MNAFRSDPKMDMRREHFEEVETYLFGEYVLNRSPEPPVKLLRDVERQLWRQAHIEMKKTGKTMAEAIKAVMMNNMFWHRYFLEHLPNFESKPQHEGPGAENIPRNSEEASVQKAKGRMEEPEAGAQGQRLQESKR